MSRSVVYGTYLTVAPLIAAGVVWAALMAARRSWRKCGTGMAVAVVGGVDLFVGPAGSWLAAGVGLFVVLVGVAVLNARRA